MNAELKAKRDSGRHFINVVKIYQVCRHLINKVGIIKDAIKTMILMRKSALLMKRVMIKRIRKYGRNTEIRKVKDIQE